MATMGTVRIWNDEQGWGIIDAPETPGGCWTHFSHLAMDGYRSLPAGQKVHLEWEEAQQDGFSFRATRAWLPGQLPSEDTSEPGPSDAYHSSLIIRFDN